MNEQAENAQAEEWVPNEPQSHEPQAQEYYVQEPPQGVANLEAPMDGVADIGAQGTPSGTPEQYEFEYPEGMDEDTLGQGVMEEFRQYMHQAGYTQDQAQQELDNHLYWLARSQEERMHQYSQDFDRWRHESTISGLTDNVSYQDANVGLSLADPTGEFRQILSESGLQHHPAFLRMARAYGRQNSQDRGTMSPGTGSGPSNLSQASEAESWVGDLNLGL